MSAMATDKHPDKLLERFRVLAEQEACRQRAMATLNLAEQQRAGQVPAEERLGHVGTILTANPGSFPRAGLSAVLKRRMTPAEDDTHLRELAAEFLEVLTAALPDDSPTGKDARGMVEQMPWTLDELRPLAEVYEALVAPVYVWTGSTPWRRDAKNDSNSAK